MEMPLKSKGTCFDMMSHCERRDCFGMKSHKIIFLSCFMMVVDTNHVLLLLLHPATINNH